ncbi:hypothetical protein DTO96_100509 [Ephemeroptericola cinctiostellae]|uniref:TIGR02453 family protein n=1 Tax=Ephemeroptericola cinctiostellae TaxID=2268024 RepID=A0A345D8W1_9BURK|nr:DUF2461 domain-containing protein [Ephemeroptericola cinctiostellae]AXF84799.1 hypothetical protein DTO96_100509 [Ephemeroptericola cinctiostellae]
MQLPDDTLPFLNELKHHNNREWFHDNKPRFAALQAQLYDFIDALIFEMASLAPEHMDIEAKQCLFRIHKDARFSKDKIPYKTHLGIHIAPSGHRADFGRAGFYLHIEPNASMIGGGAHAPSSTWLQRIRQEIALNGQVLERLLDDPIFKEWFGALRGDALKRPPAGYTADAPHLHLLKQKALWVQHDVSDTQLSDAHFTSYFAEAFSVYRPFQQFLNETVKH